MHVVKIGDRYLGLVDAQTQAIRVPDAEDGRVMVGALLSAVVKNGDNLPEGRPVLLTTRAMRAARAAALNAMPSGHSEPDQIESGHSIAAPIRTASAPYMQALEDIRDAFDEAIDRLADRLADRR